MRRPRIGITEWEDIHPGSLARYQLSVTEAGGEVVPATGRTDGDLDGLLLTGGIDVDPTAFGASDRHPRLGRTAADRDAMELSHLRSALDEDLPVLAICRGHQLLNVAFGGSLRQHVESGEHDSDHDLPERPSRWHPARIDPGSRLGRALGITQVEVNSRHHQAVEPGMVGPGLVPVAWADDTSGELVEGAESRTHRWVVSVQWHPERPEEHRAGFAPLMRRLFDAFVAEAGR